jgi:hypothetical protein
MLHPSSKIDAVFPARFQHIPACPGKNASFAFTWLFPFSRPENYLGKPSKKRGVSPKRRAKWLILNNIQISPLR